MMTALKTTAASLAAMMIAGSALAADLPSRKAPLLPPPPVFTWTGFYIGINGGYSWGKASEASTIFGLIPWTAATVSPKGGTFGGTIGWNWQASPLVVVGLEGDFGWNGMSATVTSPTLVPGFPATFNAKTDWLGTLRGRIGITPIDRLLIYGTGGVAFTNLRYTFNDFFLFGSDFKSTSKAGWVAGGGLEYAITPNWSVKVEYLHSEFGNFFDNSTPFPGILFTHSVGTFKVNTVRAGINYRFGWGAPAPVVAKY